MKRAWSGRAKVGTGALVMVFLAALLGATPTVAGAADPGAPVLSSASPVASDASSGGVRLTFTAPTTPLGSSIASYDFEISDNGTATTWGGFNTASYVGGAYPNSSATASPFVHPEGYGYCDISTADPCWYRIRAVLAPSAATTPWSDWVKVQPISGPVLASAAPVAADASSGGVRLTFSAPSLPSGLLLTSYDFEISDNGTATTWGGFNTASYVGGAYPNSSATASPFVHPEGYGYCDISTADPCWYRIRAVTGPFHSPWSSWVKVQPISGPVLASAAPVAADASSGGVRLTFSAPSLPSGLLLTSYDFEISDNGTATTWGGFNTASYVGGAYPNSSATASPFVHPEGYGYCDISTADPCWYRIRAVTGPFHSPWSSWVKVQPISAPILTSLAVVGDRVQWSFVAPAVPSGLTITSYDFEISDNGTTTTWGGFNTASYVGADEANGTATSSPFVHPEGGGYCGSPASCWYRIRAAAGPFHSPWSGWCRAGTACPGTVAVTFNANGGTGTMSPQVSSGPSALKPNAFTRAGFAFLGWNTAANGSGTAYADEATFPFASSATLYAQWAAAPTVTFNPNGGTGAMAAVSSTTPRALPANAFARTGYSFSGWNTAANGSGTAYADQAFFPFASSATLYAQWTPRPPVTVTFNANGGTGTMAVQTANSPTALTSNAFTRVGFTFSGWNTAANGSGTAYANGATYAFATGATLYAQWAPVGTRTVTFDANGGTGLMAVQTAAAPTALRANAYTRTNFSFTGWNTLANGTGTAYANGATYSFAVDVTLFAQWGPPKAATWTRTGSMGTARDDFASVLLADGKVLVAGGKTTGGGYLASAEVYDPALGTWTPTGSMSTTRSNFAMVRLPSGKVLAVGGYGSGGTRGFKASADLWDPATGAWSDAGSVVTPRAWTTATLLADGRVLVAGGDADGVAIRGCRIYDPATNSWAVTGQLPVGLYGHAAVRLPSGKVLVTAGRGQPNGGAPVRDSALFDPATGTWTATGQLSVTRATAMVALLPNGKVLAAGGVSGGGTERATAELYDPATGAWTPTGSMSAARRGAAIAVLGDGRVLVAGGKEAEYLSAAETYDPATGLWTPTTAMLDAREPKRTATALANGTVLVSGGYNSSGGYLTGAELFNPRPK